MQPLPHHYDVTVTAGEGASAEITSRGLNPLLSAPPAEFNGPGDLWSPETLTVAAVADCLVGNSLNVVRTLVADVTFEEPALTL